MLDNGLAFAFLTYTPVLPGHTLVVPRRHVTTFDELTSEERTAIEELRRAMHQALKRTYGAEGFNYAWNEGVVAGQEVPHLHLHVVPRTTGDSDRDPKARFYHWSDDRPEVPQTELLRITDEIKAAF